MTDHFKRIYEHDAARYERLVAREDQRGNLFAALMEIHPFDGLDIVDFGTGTGRVARTMSVLASRIFAFDIAPAMLQVAAQTLEASGMTNWHLAAADHRAIPLPDDSVSIAIEGWSFAHTVSWSPTTWQGEIEKMLSEMQRVVQPGGTLILLETMGTGSKEPQAPNERLADLYQWWQNEHDFQYRWIRTDYQFESVAEADELIRFFFGDEMADTLVAGKNPIIPECTGIWWKKI